MATICWLCRNKVLRQFSFNKMHPKVASAKCLPFCPSLGVISEIKFTWPFKWYPHMATAVLADYLAPNDTRPSHYSDTIMSAMASQITSLNYACLFNRLYWRRSKKTSKLRVTGLCTGNSLVTGEIPAQIASNAENVSIWLRHNVFL